MSDTPRREVEDGSAAVSQCHELPGYTESDATGDVLHHGTVTIEYQPNKYALDPEGIRDMVADTESGVPPEVVVEQVYRNVIEAIFPGYTARSDPWESAPLVVTYEYEYDHPAIVNSESTASLGTYL